IVIFVFLILVFFLFFFFFQAEDGIRDKLVTGVQTCALPIYLKSSFRFGFQIHLLNSPCPVQILIIQIKLVEPGDTHPKDGWNARSEERRVGKECRSRWWQ